MRTVRKALQRIVQDRSEHCGRFVLFEGTTCLNVDDKPLDQKRVSLAKFVDALTHRSVDAFCCQPPVYVAAAQARDDHFGAVQCPQLVDGGQRVGFHR